MESLGLSRRESCVKYLVLQIIGPNFSRKFRAKFRAAKRSFSCTVSRQISRPFWHSQPVFLFGRSAPLKPQETGAPLRQPQTSRNTPSSSFIACHHLEASHYHMCDQDERQRSGTNVLKTSFFTRKFRGCASQSLFCVFCNVFVMCSSNDPSRHVLKLSMHKIVITRLQCTHCTIRLEGYHLYQNYYITTAYFWTINLGAVT